MFTAHSAHFQAVGQGDFSGSATKIGVSCYLPCQLDLATMKGILLYVASVCPFNGSIVIFWKIHILKVVIL